LAIHNDRKLREQEPAPPLTIKGENLHRMIFDDACRSEILGYRKRRYESNQRSGQAKDHCSTRPDQMQSSHTIASNEIVLKQRYGSVLLLSSTHWAVEKWIERHGTIVHVALQLDYKKAWHLPLSIASAPFIFTRAQAGKESTLPMAELTQKLLLHAARCMRHEVMMIAFIITLVYEYTERIFASNLLYRNRKPKYLSKFLKHIAVMASDGTSPHSPALHLGHTIPQP